MVFKLSTGAVALALLFALAHDAAASSFCGSVRSEITADHAQSTATPYCSSYLSIGSKTKTVTKTVTTTTTDTVDATVTSTHTPTYTITLIDDSIVYSGVASSTILLTHTSLIPNTSYTCITYTGHATPTSTNIAAAFDAAATPWPPKTWKPKQVSSACKCLSIASATDIVTTVKTVTATRYFTKTSTSVVKATVETYKSTTVTSTLTYPSSTYVTTKTFTTTATVGPGVKFRITLDSPQATSTPNYLSPVYISQFGNEDVLIARPLGYGGNIYDFQLNAACNLYSTYADSIGFQTRDPDLIYFSDGGVPPICHIDANETPAPLVCVNEVNGGKKIYVHQETIPGTNEFYYLIALGNSSIPQSSGVEKASLFVEFETGGPR